MFTETLNLTSRNDENMELSNSIEELDNDDDDDDIEFPPLPSNIDLITHIDQNPGPYDNRNRTIDFFYCPSPPFPSPPPPPPPTSSTTMTRIYANARTFASIRNSDSIYQPIISFATQHKRKTRAPIACLLQSVYVNLPKPRSPPPPTPVNTTNEVTYATLLNTTSMLPSITSELTINHVEYQQIQHKSDQITYSRIYENVKFRPPPPPPPALSSSPIQTNIPQRPPSWSIIPLEEDKPLLPLKKINNELISSSSAHIYINLEYNKDKPPTIPTRKCKSVRTNKSTTSSSSSSTPPPPPIIPPRNEQKGEIRCSSSSVTTYPSEKEQDIHETSSNASTVQTVKELHVNLTPSCSDKSELYRTKVPLTTIATTENVPSFVNARQRRPLHSARRRRLRGSVAVRGSIGLRSASRGLTNNNNNNNPNRQQPQQQHSNANVTVRHPMVTDDRWRRTLHKRRRQRALQMKLDGNVLNQQTKSSRRKSDHTYNEINQAIVSNNRVNTNCHNGAAGGVLERAMQFNGALRDRVFSWYRGANHTGREQVQEQTKPQVFPTSENGESDQKGTTTNEEEEEEEEEEEDEEEVEGEEEEEEQEFFAHDTFEDFLLRRRPKSSNSTTTSGTSTVVSRLEPVSQRVPVRPTSNKKPHVPPPLPPPPPKPTTLPPLLPPTPPPSRRFAGLALSLDKTDVDFIHNMLQRTRGDHRVWNRITALKEAYIRATSKKNDLPKKPKPIQIKMDENKNKKPPAMKHSLATTKIRAELEKYDELPASSPTIAYDEDDYDETCSTNVHHKIDYNPHHRSAPTLPRTPSTTHRLLSFVTSIKQRAQSNVQQLQKNFQDIRSRVQVESMVIPSNNITIQRHTSTTSRHKQILKDSSNTSRTHLTRGEPTPKLNHVFHRSNSHRSATSIEQSNHPHRRQFSRTQSNASQLPISQQRHTTHRQHHRSTNEKPVNIVDRTPDVPTRPPPIERRSLRQTQNGIASHQQRLKKPS